MIDRRRFLQGAGALFCAPAIVKADNLMSIWVPPAHQNLADFIFDISPSSPPLFSAISAANAYMGEFGSKHIWIES